MTGISTLNQALDQITRINQQQSLLDLLTEQATTGQKADLFSGLGSDVLPSLTSRAASDSLTTYGDNITNASTRMNLMANTLSEFKTQAQSFLNALVGTDEQGTHSQGDPVTVPDPANPTGPGIQVGTNSTTASVDITNLQSLASNLYDFLTNLLNTQNQGRYLLGGADTQTPPLTDSGTLDSAITNLITQWKSGAISTTELSNDLTNNTASASAPGAITDTTVGYNAALSSGNAGDVFVRVTQSSEINYTTLANDSSLRDVIVGLAYIKNATLTPVVNGYTPPNAPPSPPDAQGAPGATLQDQENNFFQVFNTVTQMVTNAVTNVDKLSDKISTAQARITDLQSDQAQQQNVLQDTISSAETVDVNEVAVKLNALQTQLQASFSVTADLQKYTLVNFLTGNQ